MKFIKYFFVLILVIAINACTAPQLNYTVDIAVMNSDYITLVERYDELRSLIVPKMDTLSLEDQMQLKSINDNVERIIFQVDQLRSAKLNNVSPADLGYMYILGKQTYETSKELYVKHQDKLSPSEKISIEFFDSRVKELDKHIQEFLKNPDNETINYTMVSILTLVSTGLKIAIPLMSL